MKKFLIRLSALLIEAALLPSPGHAATYPGTQPLPNGDFELQRTFWTVAGDADIWYLSQNWVAVFGNPWNPVEINCLGSISQRVAVPEERPVLGFWFASGSYDASGAGSDQFAVVVDGVSIVKTIHLIQANDTNGFELRVVDLSSWSGESIDLYFAFETDEADQSVAFLDDIFFAPAGYLFSDGFEAGLTVRWSIHVP